MANLNAAQSAARQHPNADGADIVSASARNQIPVVLRRIVRRQLHAGAGIEKVVAHLRGFESIQHIQNGWRIAKWGEDEMANLALLAQARKGGQHLVAN